MRYLNCWDNKNFWGAKSGPLTHASSVKCTCLLSKSKYCEKIIMIAIYSKSEKDLYEGASTLTLSLLEILHKPRRSLLMIQITLIWVSLSINHSSKIVQFCSTFSNLGLLKLWYVNFPLCGSHIYCNDFPIFSLLIVGYLRYFSCRCCCFSFCRIQNPIIGFLDILEIVWMADYLRYFFAHAF